MLAELAAQGAMVNGAGLVMADGVLADRPRHLEWWRAGDGSAEPRKLAFDLNPRSDYFYDHSDMEWFAAPRERGIR